MRQLLLSLVLICSSGVAQTVSVPTEVFSVQTVGYWQSGSATGSYRVVVTSEGWEHAWSRVFVEWLEEPTDHEAPQLPPLVVELVPPLAQGSAVLEASAQSRKASELIVTVHATSNMELGAKKRRFVFRAGAPGVIRLLHTPKHK